MAEYPDAPTNENRGLRRCRASPPEAIDNPSGRCDSRFECSIFMTEYVGWIHRNAMREALEAALRRSRIGALIGPWQCAKTTLARHFLGPESANYRDLEDAGA